MLYLGVRMSKCEDAIFRCEGALAISMRQHIWKNTTTKVKNHSGRPCNCLYVTKTVLKGRSHERFDWEWESGQKAVMTLSRRYCAN